MSGLAQVLAQRGCRVSGSDQQQSATLDRLAERGVEIHLGHQEANLADDLDCLVVSAAVGTGNPELIAARRRGLTIRKYAEMLGELSGQIPTFAVAGTHGKSTTSGWLTYAIKSAGMDPSYVIGAGVHQLSSESSSGSNSGGGSGSGAGADPLLIVEACEFDRSFLNLHPAAAAILNIERDHLDYYSGLDEIVRTFGRFAHQIHPDGLLVANADDDNVAEALAGYPGKCEFFSVEGKASWQAGDLVFEKGCGVFDLIYQGNKLGRLKLTLPGRHNVANALAVAALARHGGLNDQQICSGLENFTGVARRMTLKGQVAEVVVLDDYAHHPTEIKVTLEAIRARFEPRRLWCVFQPHQHSRTRFLLQEFARSFGCADIILLPDIYFVRDSEASRREINAAMLAEVIVAQGGQAHYLGGFDQIIDYLGQTVNAGDVVVTMGAGDVWKIADELVSRLGRDR